MIDTMDTFTLEAFGRENDGETAREMLTFVGPIVACEKITCIGDAIESSRRKNACVSFWGKAGDATRMRLFLTESALSGYDVRRTEPETEFYCDASWEESYVVTGPAWAVRVVFG